MHLDRLIAALGPIEVANAAPLEIAELAYDTRAVPAGSLFFCIPGDRVDGHELAAEAVGVGCGSARRRAAGRRGGAAAASRSVRAAMPVAAAEFFGDPSRELDVAGFTGHEREDDLGISPRECPRRRRTADRAADEHRAQDRWPAAADGAEHARVRRPAAPLPRDARVGRPLVRDGGDVDRRCQGTPRRHALRRARLHEPDAGPPRLPRLDGGVLRGEARALRAGGARRRQRGRRVGRAARRRASRCAHVHAGRRAGGHRSEAARRVQPRERARRDLGGPRARRRRGRDQARDRGARRCARAVRVRRRRTAVRGDRRLRAHPRLARERPARRARRRRARDRGLRRRRRPRPREAAADGPDRRRACRPRDRHHGQPALRGSCGDRRGRRRGATRDRARPARRDRDGARTARAQATSS